MIGDVAVVVWLVRALVLWPKVLLAALGEAIVDDWEGAVGIAKSDKHTQHKLKH